MTQTENNEINLSIFFELFDIIKTNIIVIFGTASVLTLILYLYFNNIPNKFTFNLELDEPKDFIGLQISELRAIEPEFVIDKKLLLELYVDALKNSDLIKNNLKKFLKKDNSYFKKNLSDKQYEVEIIKLSNLFKINDPVLDKELARIRGVQVSEHYRLILQDIEPLDDIIIDVINNLSKDAEEQALLKLKSLQSDFFTNKKMILNVQLENNKTLLKRRSQVFNEELQLKKLDYSRKIDEKLLFLRKNLKLAQALGIEEYIYDQIGIVNLDPEDSNLSLLFDSVDSYYKKGSKFIMEEINFINESLVEIPFSEIELLSNIYRKDKFDIEDKVESINILISNLNNFNNLFNNLELFEPNNDQLFNNYISYENNIRVSSLYSLKSLILSFIIIFSLITCIVILVSSYKKYKIA